MLLLAATFSILAFTSCLANPLAEAVTNNYAPVDVTATQNDARDIFADSQSGGSYAPTDAAVTRNHARDIFARDGVSITTWDATGCTGNMLGTWTTPYTCTSFEDPPTSFIFTSSDPTSLLELFVGEACGAELQTVPPNVGCASLSPNGQRADWFIMDLDT